MIVKTCSQCGETQKESLCWTVAAWQTGDGQRVAYKQKLCLTCQAGKLAPLQVHSDNEGMLCPACRKDTAQDYDAVYLTWIPKGVGMLQAELPFCNVHAAEFRIWFKEGALELDDQDRSIGGRTSAPRYSAAETLAALGIRPRA